MTPADFDQAQSEPRESDGISLGRYSYIKPGLEMEFGGRVAIGNYSGIGHQCVLLSGRANHASAGTRYVSNYPWDHLPPQDILIGSDVWIGVRVTILPGVHIADGSIVGAGAVVSKDTTPFSVTVGNPGREIKCRFDQDVIESLMEIRWWDWPHPVVDVARRLPEFRDARQFLTIAPELARLAASVAGSCQQD